ncbi:TAXI family TRAP transporter solute-binding subunit [Acidobacteriota bacterium]
MQFRLKKYRLIFILAVAICIAAVSGISAETQRLIMATATTGGTYYPVGVAIANLTTLTLGKSDGIILTAISSAGSGENIQLLKNKEADLAIIQGLYGAMAWQGRDRYSETPQRFIRSVTRLWENVEHFTVMERYVKQGDMSDLKNMLRKNFSIGKRGSGTEISGRVILRSLGFDPEKDFKLKYLGYTPSANALQNRRIGGMNIPAGPPAAAVTQAFASVGGKRLRILNFSDRQLIQVNRSYKIWNRALIPPGTYPGQEEEVRTISQSNLLVVHQDVSEETVYKILKTIYCNLDNLQKIHQSTKEISLDRALEGLAVPLHPGAVRFFREKNVEIPPRLLYR